MEKEPAQQVPQQTGAMGNITATGQDNMPVMPPPPFTVISSGPAGVERSGSDTLSPAIKPQGMTPPPLKIEASSRPALPQGRLIAQSVGAGGVNDAGDVTRVLARLRALKVITAAEEADHSSVTTYVTRYQSLVNDSAPDGLMEPGRKTEGRLIEGVTARTAKTKPYQKPAAKPANAKTVPTVEQKARAVYRSILKETPATEAGAVAILARGDTFAENAFADLARMGRFDLLHALKEEVWAFDRDWIARSIMKRLSDAELTALPDEFLAQMQDALDAGITSTDEYALMGKLDKVMDRSKPSGKEVAAEEKPSTAKQPRSTKGIYVISAADASLRDDKFEIIPGKVFPRWIDVTVAKEQVHKGKTYAYAKAKDSSVEGWTAKSNLYSLDWSAKMHEKEYRGHCDGYYEMMAANDPETTRKDLVKSGKGAKEVIDRYFPNYTSPDGLFVGKEDFREKAKSMLSFWEANGITYQIESAVRHPLRSAVFNYAAQISYNGSEDKVEEANAVCRKYGIPIDWAHRKADGSIDLATSVSKAKEVCKAFGLAGSKAARGVSDFGGGVSNHNKGQALDVKLTFTRKVTIVDGGVTYEILPKKEIGTHIPDVQSTPLSLLCKKKFKITRAIPDDAIHWSLTGR